MKQYTKLIVEMKRKGENTVEIRKTDLNFNYILERKREKLKEKLKEKPDLQLATSPSLI